MNSTKRPFQPKPYRGRFAPSPTGPLHFGSMVAAVGSYLDAKHNNGQWLVRIEDVDEPRCSQQAADNILYTLEAYGLHWDETVLYQSQRSEIYEQAIQKLSLNIYPCCCTRKEIADSALNGIDGQIYPGNCRQGLPPGRQGRALRIKTNDDIIHFQDRIQGNFQQNLHQQIGDYIIKRADDFYAYQLAVVVDDGEQQINHIVRGIDLLHSTPRQIYLQQLLNIDVPKYLHLPIAVNNQGEKLSKQTLAPAIEINKINENLYYILQHLKQNPPKELLHATREKIINWAINNWNIESLRGLRHFVITTA